MQHSALLNVWNSGVPIQLNLKLNWSELERTKIYTCIFGLQIMATLLDQWTFWTGKGLLLTGVSHLVSHFRPCHTHEWPGHGAGHGPCRGPARPCPGACPGPLWLSELKNAIGSSSRTTRLKVDRRLPGDWLHESFSITRVIINTKSQEILITEIRFQKVQKYKLHEWSNTNYRNTKTQITEVKKYK